MPNPSPTPSDQAEHGPLPEPVCKLGYTDPQLAQIFGGTLGRFQRWMRGQTVAICQTTDGVGACCGGHGVVTYAGDVRHYLAGGEPLD